VQDASAAPGAVVRLPRFAAAVDAARPEEPHAYLAAIAVTPHLRGRGVGDRLLLTVLTSIDGDGAAWYLEAQDPATVVWYERRGFRVQGRPGTLVPGGPTNWRMLRPVAGVDR
jgi:ribosomal protein S18 acetylase RimI-like enzyme